MLPTLSPRPWMPLRHRRFVLGFTTVPRTGRPVRRDDDGQRRPLAPTGASARRRGLFRRTPSARELRHRLDELAADAEAWIAELAANERGA